ncbi:hypothetical protein D920_01454 [Enterococcus faecalis 13-SD-W-01]|nr:hypothetical protein D920_01454 [Enterococcus faecalis 13-SD-W-01]
MKVPNQLRLRKNKKSLGQTKSNLHMAGRTSSACCTPIFSIIQAFFHTYKNKRLGNRCYPISCCLITLFERL